MKNLLLVLPENLAILRIEFETTQTTRQQHFSSFIAQSNLRLR